MAIDDAAFASFAFAFHVFSMALYWPLPLICLTTNDDEYSANDSVTHCSSGDPIFTTWPQYWCAISCAKRWLMPCEKTWLISAPTGLNASLVMNIVAGGAWP